MKLDISPGLITMWMSRTEMQELVNDLRECLKYANETELSYKSTNEAKIEFMLERS